MDIRRLSGHDPYSAFLSLHGAKNGFKPLLKKGEPGAAGLASPLIKSQLLAQSQRYEALSGKLGGILGALDYLGNSANAPRVSVRTTSLPGTNAGATRARTQASAAELQGDRIQLTEGTGITTTASLTTGAVSLNLSGQTTATHTGTRVKLSAGTNTDFGSITIDGITTQLGAISNQGATSQDAAWFIANAINANSDNAVTASVGGRHNDQVILSSKTAGSAGNFSISAVAADSDGNTKNNRSAGFTAGESGTAVDGSTDFGSVTIDGVTTTLGLLSNTGQTAQSAAQYIVDQLNANANNTVTASLGGANNDQIVLTAKEAGSAGNFSINAVSTDSNGSVADDGVNGFIAGSSAAGQDPGIGRTDFGSVSINGITTSFGVLDNNLFTDQTAAQYLADRINETNSTVRASIQDGRVLLTSRETGSDATITVDRVTGDSDGDSINDRPVGFQSGDSASGTDARTNGAAGPAEETLATERTVDQAQVGALVGKARELVEAVNDYQASLSDEREHGLRGIQRNSAELSKALDKASEDLAAVGFQVKDGRLEFDEVALRRAVDADPSGAAAAFGRVKEAIAPEAGAQQVSVDSLRESKLYAAKVASQISQAAIAIKRVETQKQVISRLVEQAEELHPKLNEQSERLGRQRQELEQDGKTPAAQPPDKRTDEKPEDTPWYERSIGF